MTDAMWAATDGSNACERGDGWVSEVLSAGGGAPMVAHNGQSSLGVSVLLDSSPGDTNFITPTPAQTSIVV